MSYSLSRTQDADDFLEKLGRDKGRAAELKAVKKALGLLQMDPHYNSLYTSKLEGHSYKGKELFHSRSSKGNRICWIWETPEPTEEVPNPTKYILVTSIGDHDHYK